MDRSPAPFAIPLTDSPLDRAIVRFVEAKDWFLQGTGLSHDAIHVHLGLALFALFHFVLRRRPGSLVPLALLLVLSVSAEWADIRALQAVRSPWSLAESARDVGNTIVWPLLLTLAARLWAWRQAGRDLGQQDKKSEGARETGTL